MVSLFYARRYPAGREVKPDDQPVPNADTPVSDANVPSSTLMDDSQPSDAPPVDDLPLSSGDSSPTPTPTDVLPMTTNSPGVLVQSSDIPDQSPQPSDPPPPPATTTPLQNPPPGSTPPASSDPPHSSTIKYDPRSAPPEPTQTDYFIPSSALNNPLPTQTLGTDTTPASSSTIVSTPDLQASGTVTLSTDTLQPTSTTVLNQGGELLTGSSSNKKYIIGGAVGGGVLVMILLALFVFCCRKRRAKRDPERSGGSHSDGQPGYGQFACCSHGNCSSNGQSRMEQKTPLKPFVLQSDSAPITPKEDQQRRIVSLSRRNSTESQNSAGSETTVGSLYSSDSAGSQHSRRSQKRPPPLKLTSLITPVIHGPQNNPRQRVHRSSLPNMGEIPAIVVEPPQSESPDRMERR